MFSVLSVHSLQKTAPKTVEDKLHSKPRQKYARNSSDDVGSRLSQYLD